jgi:hypothetical protein
MLAVLSPELDRIYDTKAPEFEVVISSGCGCPDDGQHEIEIRVSRENNKRHLNATTYMSCEMLQRDGGVVDLVDLRDGFWQGTVAVNTLDLYHDIRFSYVTPFNPRIEVLLPLPGYVFGINTNPVIVVHVCDVTAPHEPLLGVKVLVYVNGEVVGETKNPGRDKYIHLRTADGQYFPDGTYEVQLQTVDLLDRPRGEPAHLVVDIDRSVETGVRASADETLNCPLDDSIELCPKCSSHGRCNGGSVCECDPDWIGHLCEHNMLFHTHYLPPAVPVSTSMQCQRQRLWDSNLLALAAEVDRLHNPIDCYSNAVKFLKDERRHPLALGHGLRWEALMLGESVRNASAYLPLATWALFDYDECRGLGLWCHFEHPSACRGVAGYRPEAEIQSEVEVVHVTRRWELAEGFKGVGLFQWSSTLMGLIARPRGGIQAKMLRLKRIVGFQHPIIGMHVRYGDGCLPNQMHRPPCEPIEAYMQEVRRLARHYNVSRLYVASDSSEVIDRMQEMEDMQVLHMPLDRTIFDSHWWIDHRAAWGVLDRKQVAESALLDMLMLAECDYFIGTFSSHFSMSALELSTFKKGNVPPYVSGTAYHCQAAFFSCHALVLPLIVLLFGRYLLTVRGSPYVHLRMSILFPIANKKFSASAAKIECEHRESVDYGVAEASAG